MGGQKDDGIPIRRYTKAKPFPVLPVVAAGLGVVLVILIVTITMLVMGGGGDVSANGGGGGVNLPVALGGQPTAENEGQKWTPKQLAEHFKSKGLITEFEGGEVVKMPAGDWSSPVKVRTPKGEVIYLEKESGPISIDQWAKGKMDKWDKNQLPGQVAVTWGLFGAYTYDGIDGDAASLFRHLKGSKYWGRGDKSGTPLTP